MSADLRIPGLAPVPLVSGVRGRQLYAIERTARGVTTRIRVWETGDERSAFTWAALFQLEAPGIAEDLTRYGPTAEAALDRVARRAAAIRGIDDELARAMAPLAGVALESARG